LIIPLWNLLLVRGAQKSILLSVLCGLVTNVVAHTVLTTTYGPMGAALVDLITQTVVVICLAACVTRLLKSEVRAERQPAPVEHLTDAVI
jgi:O-antigen/teichoic acid export membrane protein